MQNKETQEIQIREINDALKKILDGSLSLDYYQIERLPPLLRYYVYLINDAFSRRLIEYVPEEIEVRIPFKFEDVERMKVEMIPYGNCYSEVLGRHRYAHVILPYVVCDDGECVDLRKVKIVDVEGKVREVEIPQISFYVRQPLIEVEGGRKRIKNRYGRMKILLTYWINGTRFHRKIFDVYVVLRGHALIRRKDRIYIKKTRTGRMRIVEQRTKEGLFLEIFIVKKIKMKKEDLMKMINPNLKHITKKTYIRISEYQLYNGIYKMLYKKNMMKRGEEGAVELYKVWQVYNRVYRKKSGKERRVLKLYLKRPEKRKRVEFGNQAFWIEDKGKYKYLLRNMAQHRNVKEFVLKWEEGALNHKITSNKPVDVHEEFIVVNGMKIGKKWVIGAKENGVEIDIYNYHHMDMYSKIHVSLNANEVLVITHRDPRA